MTDYLSYVGHVRARPVAVLISAAGAALSEVGRSQSQEQLSQEFFRHVDDRLHQLFLADEDMSGEEVKEVLVLRNALASAANAPARTSVYPP